MLVFGVLAGVIDNCRVVCWQDSRNIPSVELNTERRRMISRTNVIHKCNLRSVKKLYMKLPSGGIMLGYVLVFWRSTSSLVNRGPGYILGRTLREPCEGGLNLAGFSKMRDLSVSGALVVAWRIVGDWSVRRWSCGEGRALDLRRSDSRGTSCRLILINCATRSYYACRYMYRKLEMGGDIGRPM